MIQSIKQTEQKGINVRVNRVDETISVTREIKRGWEDMRGVGGFM